MKRLDRIVTIQRKSDTQSDSGEPMEAWSNLVLRRAASMWPVRGDERFASPEKVATDQTEFRVRYSADVADLGPLDRIIWPALVIGEDPDEAPTRRIYDILVVSEINRRDGLKIIAERRADVYEVEAPVGVMLDFSDPNNSMFLALFGPGALAADDPGALDFSIPYNSGLIAAIGA